MGERDARRGRTIVTLEDVARAAGVHYSTVSRALDPATVRRVSVDTRKHVQAVAKKMGYQPDMVASGLKRGRTQTVAVIAGDLGNPNIAPVLRGIANELEKAGLMSLISETQDDSARLERVLDHLMRRRVDAIIMTAARLKDAPTLRRLRRQGIPLVLAVQNVPGIRLPAATNDDVLGGVLAAKPPKGSPEEGALLMRELLDKKGARPTGIFVHHDLMAFGALTAAEERGLTAPRDLSVIGYHNLPHDDRIVPPLTSIRQHREELGRIAAEILVAILNSPGRSPAPRRIAPSLVVRQSTGPPPVRILETVRKS